MQVQPYLFFDGCGEAAVDFYRSALGAEVGMLMRYKEGPEPAPPGMEDKLMHASFRIGDSIVMAADDCAGKQSGCSGFALSLTVADAAEADRVFVALADGGEVRMALAKTFWSPCFGMVADRFGVLWMVNVATEESR